MLDQAEEIGPGVGERAANVILGEALQLPEHRLSHVAQVTVQVLLREIIDHTRQDVAEVKEPRFQALLETTAEVLEGLETAFRHYSERKEPAWKH